MTKVIQTIVGLVLAAVIAAGGYFTKSYTVDEAVDIVTDTAKASDACTKLLKGQGYGVQEPAQPSDQISVPADSIS